MRKMSLRNQQTTKGTKQVSAAYRVDVHPVDQAAKWSDELVMHDLRGPGDLDNALQRVGRRIGVGYRTLWNLRYRKPKDLSASAFLKIWSAWGEFQENQMKRLSNDVEAAQATARNQHHFVASAAALVATYYGPDGDHAAPVDGGHMAMTEGEQ